MKLQAARFGDLLTVIRNEFQDISKCKILFDGQVVTYSVSTTNGTRSYILYYGKTSTRVNGSNMQFFISKSDKEDEVISDESVRTIFERAISDNRDMGGAQIKVTTSDNGSQPLPLVSMLKDKISDDTILYSGLVELDSVYLLRIESVWFRMMNEFFKISKSNYTLGIPYERRDNTTDPIKFSITEKQFEELKPSFKQYMARVYKGFLTDKQLAGMICKPEKEVVRNGVDIPYNRLFAVSKIFIPAIFDIEFFNYNPIWDELRSVLHEKSELNQFIENNEQRWITSRTGEEDCKIKSFFMTHEELCKCLHLKNFVRFTPRMAHEILVGLIFGTWMEYPYCECKEDSYVFVPSETVDAAPGYVAMSYPETEYEQELIKTKTKLEEMSTETKNFIDEAKKKVNELDSELQQRYAAYKKYTEDKDKSCETAAKEYKELQKERKKLQVKAERLKQDVKILAAKYTILRSYYTRVTKSVNNLGSFCGRYRENLQKYGPVLLDENFSKLAPRDGAKQLEDILSQAVLEAAK